MSRDEFEKLIEQNAHALWCFVRSRAPHRADDVCQETWLRAWQNLRWFDGRNFRAWLFRIARNVITDEARKRQTISLAEESGLVDKQDTSGLENVLDQERKAVVAECMKKLSPEEADVVRRRTEGWSNEEIAEKLRVSEKRVYTLFFQGKTKLKSCVERKLP